MKKKYVAAAVALSLVAGHAQAASRCIGPDDELAMKTSSMQQALMVAALSCGDAALYNRFVLSYRPELQQADATLLTFFMRENGARGEADYHSFKTKAANISALESARDSTGYCANAQRLFTAAFNSGYDSLGAFVASQWQGTAEIIRARCTADADAPAVAPTGGYGAPVATQPVEPSMSAASE
jgi:hypothetical protein